MSRFWQLKKDHFHSAVLGYLPEQLHDLTAGQPTDQDAQQPSNSSNMGKFTLLTADFVLLFFPIKLKLDMDLDGGGDSSRTRFGRTSVHSLLAGLRFDQPSRVSTCVLDRENWRE